VSKPLIPIALALVRRGSRWLIAQRLPHVHLANQWEFPGGKFVPAEETPAAAAVRELREETGVTATARAALDAVTFEYDDRIVELWAVVCEWVAGEGQPLECQQCRWVTLDQMRVFELPAANAEIIARLERES